MLAPHVYENTHSAPINVVKASAYKRKPFGRKILDVRSKLHASTEPWLHVMRITGCHLKGFVLEK
jgi:hypothetical protein